MESAARSYVEPGVSALFASEIVLPAQFWSAQGDLRSEPEKRLMVAVLEEAMATLLNWHDSSSSAARQLAAEARQWIASDDRSSPFSFATICDVLGLDTTRVRAVIDVRLERRQLYARHRRMQAGRGRHRVRFASRRRRRPATAA
jgi:hypothetical protein